MALPLLRPLNSNPSVKPTKLEPEYAPSYAEWQSNPNPQTTGNLLKAIRPAIDRAVHVYTGTTDPIIVSKARSIALNSLPRYDAKQAKLGTYLMNQLQSLKRVARQQQQVISIPERVQMDSQSLHRVESELTEKLGREPSTAELSRNSGLSAKRIAHVRKFRYPVSESQMTSVDEDGNESTPGGVQSNEHAKVWREIVYLDADPIAQKIMEWSFGMHGSPVLSNQAIAIKLRLSPGAVSQRKANIQQMLDSEQEISPYG